MRKMLQLDEATKARAPTPCLNLAPRAGSRLWFESAAENAAAYYTSLFANSRINNIARLKTRNRAKQGHVVSVAFTLAGQQFIAVNGAAASVPQQMSCLSVNCDNQQQIDFLWRRLADGGQEIGNCRLVDAFNLMWEITPAFLDDMLGGNDSARARRVLDAMTSMKKPDIARLIHVYDEEAHPGAVSQKHLIGMKTA